METSKPAWTVIAMVITTCLTAACASEDPGHRPLPRPPTPVTGGSLAGEYFFSGKLPSGAMDAGRVTLTPRAASYDVTWSENGEKAAEGIAVQVGDVLAIVRGRSPKDFWNDYVDLGVAIFDIRGDELWGMRIFAGDPMRRADTQRFRRAAGLADRFDMIDPSGAAATKKPSQLNVTPNGDAYLFAWYDPMPTYIGTGVRLGDRYIVGIASTNLPAVIALCRIGDTLRGVGVANSSKVLSEETVRIAARFWLTDDLESGACPKWLAEHGMQWR